MAQKYQKEDMQILNQVFQYLPTEVEISLSTSYYLCSSGSFGYHRSMTSKRLSIDQDKLYTLLQSKLDELLEGKSSILQAEFRELLESFAPFYNVGDQFRDVTGIDAIETQDYIPYSTLWKPRQGIVTLVVLWKCNADSITTLQRLQRMLVNNVNWKGQVEIVGLSVENDLQSLIKTIQEKQLELINHYWFQNLNDRQNITLNIFKQNSQYHTTPYIALLNNQGRIVQLGHLSILLFADKLISNLLGYQNKPIKVTREKQEEYEIQIEQDNILDPREFKRCKAKLRGDIREFIKQLDLQNQYVLLGMDKTNILSQTGKILQKRSKLILQYSVQIDDKPEIMKLISYLDNHIPKEILIIRRAEITYPLIQLKQVINFVEQICKTNGVSIHFHYRRIFKYTYNWMDETLKQKQDRYKYIPIVRKITPEQFQAIQKEFKVELLLFHDDILTQIRKAVQLQDGEQFQSIRMYNGLNQDASYLIHKEGEILIFYFWVYYSQSDIENLVKFNEIIKLNKGNWGNQVKLFAINIDNDVQSYLSFVENNKQLDEIQFSYANKNVYYHTCLFYFNPNNPQYLIVDQKGTLKYLNYSDNLQEQIENVRHHSKQQGPVDQSQLQQSAITMQQLRSLKLFLDQSKYIFKGFGLLKYAFQFELQIVELYQSDAADAELIKVEQLSLKHWVRANKQKQLNEILTQIFKIVPKEQFAIMKECVSPTFDIPFPGQECVICKCELNDDIQQYYSPFKNEFVCVACAEFDDKSQIGLARYKYSDTLIFINAPLTDLSILKEIDEYKLGKNMKIDAGEEGSQYFQHYCAGCEVCIEGPKFLTISPRPENLFSMSDCSFCQFCFAVLKNKSSPQARSIIRKNMEAGKEYYFISPTMDFDHETQNTINYIKQYCIFKLEPEDRVGGLSVINQLESVYLENMYNYLRSEFHQWMKQHLIWQYLVGLCTS